MPWIQRIALALLTFGFTGLALIVWQPSSLATTPNDHPAFDLAISTGTGLRLAETAAEGPSAPRLLSCDKVLIIGGISIGAHCVSHGWEVSIRD